MSKIISELSISLFEKDSLRNEGEDSVQVHEGRSLRSSTRQRSPSQPAEREVEKKHRVEMAIYPTVSSIQKVRPPMETIAQKEGHEQAYASLTRRFTPEQHKELAGVAQEFSKEIDELCHLVQRGNLDDPIFVKENTAFPFLALAAFKDNKLSLEDFSAVMNYWSILQYHDKEEIATLKFFKENGEVDEEVKAMLRETMVLSYAEGVKA